MDKVSVGNTYEFTAVTSKISSVYYTTNKKFLLLLNVSLLSGEEIRDHLWVPLTKRNKKVLLDSTEKLKVCKIQFSGRVEDYFSASLHTKLTIKHLRNIKIIDEGEKI